MRQIIDADKLAVKLAPQIKLLKKENRLGVIRRKTKYGSAPGLVPLGDTPDKLVDPKDYKEVIERCHREKIFPMYHQNNTWGPKGFKWNQNGLNYCWAWSLVGDIMNCRAVERKPTKLLAPVSLGWTVGWKNRGNYLEDGIKAVKERGICEARFVPDEHSKRSSSFEDGWEKNGLLYRLPDDGVWDTDRSNMIQHAITILSTGRSGYIAYNWWGHALSLVGLIWDETQANNLRWIIRNSHNEPDFIELTGRRGIPDELLGIRATLSV